MKKGIFEKFETMMAASAFAEAGEFDTAIEIMREDKDKRAEKRPTDRPVPRVQAPGAKR